MLLSLNYSWCDVAGPASLMCNVWQPFFSTPSNKARQIRFPVYRPRPHAILARLPNFHFSLWPCDYSTWRLNMASFVSIQLSSANATLVPWSVVSLDPSQRFLDLFSFIQAGKFSIFRTSSELSAAVLESVCIGSDKSNLSRVEKEGKDPYLLPK